jgi:hypothetical protein
MADVAWFKKDAWRAIWIALRRAPRDKKARTNLIRLLISLILFGLWLTFNVVWLHGYWSSFGRPGDIFLAVFAIWVIALLVIPIIGDRMEKRAQERTSPSVSPELKTTFFRETCLLAILLERLSSEAYLEKEIPPEITIVTRRVLLDRLNSLGIREGLEPWLLDLLLAPDGHWTAEQKQRALPVWECLTVFRWALGLDQLPDLTSVPEYRVEHCRSLFKVKRPEQLFALPSWDLRPARNAAENFFWRCWAELIARQEVSANDDSQIERALEFRSQIQEEGYTGDYVIGARTVTELKTDLLFFLASRAYRRWQFLSLLVNVATGDASPAVLRGFLAHFFAPAEIDPAIDIEKTI